MVNKFLWYIVLIISIAIDFSRLFLSLIEELLVRFYKGIFAFSAGSPKKILIIRTDRLGDAVVTTPVIRALKDLNPDLKIYVLASTKNEIIFKNNPHIEKVYSIKIDSWLQYRPQRLTTLDEISCILKEFTGFLKEQLLNRCFWKTLIQLKQQNIDLSLDFVGRRRTSFIGKFIAKQNITHNLKSFSYLSDYCMEFAYVTTYPKKHIIERYFYLLSQGIKNFKNVNPFDYSCEIYSCNKRPIEKRNGILFHIGGAVYRRLDNYRLLDIIKETSKINKSQIHIIDEPGNPNRDFFKKKLAKYKIEFIEKIDIESFINFLDRNISLAIIPDSGIAHTCTALTNTLIYFGPGAVWVWHPWGPSKPKNIMTHENKVQVWETKGKYLNRFIFSPTDCSPCFDIGCEELHCLQPLKSEHFIQQIEELIKL